MRVFWGFAFEEESVQGVGMLQSTTSSSTSTGSGSPAAPGSCLRGPRVLPAGVLRDCVVGLLSFMAAAVNMTGCLETICFQWLPHGNRELNLRRARRLSRRQRPPSPRAVLQGWWEGVGEGIGGGVDCDGRKGGRRIRGSARPKELNLAPVRALPNIKRHPEDLRGSGASARARRCAHTHTHISGH